MKRAATPAHAAFPRRYEQRAVDIGRAPLKSNSTWRIAFRGAEHARWTSASQPRIEKIGKCPALSQSASLVRYILDVSSTATPPW